MRTPRRGARTGRAGKKAGTRASRKKPLPPGVPASGSLADLPVPDKGDETQGGAAVTLVLQSQVVSLMRAGADLAMMRQVIREKSPSVSQTMVDNMYASILREWRALAKEERSTSRVLVVSRLKADLANIRAGEQEQIFEELPDPNNAGRFIRRVRSVRRINWNAVRGHERLLAQIEGTLAPIKVQVQTNELLREGLLDRVNEMSAEEQEERIQRAAERRKQMRVITVPGHEIGTSTALAKAGTGG